jgi:hypothetical protein
MTDRLAMLNVDGIPAELRLRPQWVAWRHEQRKGKPTKVPINPKTGKRAASNDAATWETFDAALTANDDFHCDGVGYVFSADDPYCGIDLDACRNPETGELTPWAQEVVDKVNSYTDSSPSGTGVKIVARGSIDLPRNVKKLKGVETFGDKAPEIAIYNHHRFWCLTGRRHPGTPTTVEHRPAELKALCAELFPPKATGPTSGENSPAQPAGGKLFDKLCREYETAQNGDRSEIEWNLLCTAQRKRWDKEQVWHRVGGAGRFAERGRKFFDEQWNKAAAEHEPEKPCKSRARPQPKREYKPEGRKEIELTTEEDVINRAVAAELTKDSSLFCRGSLLVTIGDDDGSPVICDLPEALVRDRIAARVQFFTIMESGNGASTRLAQHPQAWCVKAIDAWPNWAGMRQLAGVVTVPTIRPDGSLLDSHGYDPATKLVYRPGDCIPNVPEHPDADDAQYSLDVLFDVVRDFPFKSESHQATWLSHLLSIIARSAFSGPAPLFAFDATTAGTGKSLLADVSFNIAYGSDAPRFSNPTSEEESRKRITTLAVAGTEAVLIDNIAGVFGTPSLDAALTATEWSDRLLGVNKGVRLPMRIIWAATGNNLILKPDTARRVAHIRLEAREERPDLREGFKYPELLSHVRQHRADLLGAALTIVRAWFTAGCPKAHLPSWGSYEGWSAVIRQAVVWLGLPDPADTREEFRAVADRETAAFADLIEGLLDADPNCNGLTSAEIFEKVDKEPESYKPLRNALLELCADKNGKITVRGIGTKLSHLRGRIINGRYIDYDPQRANRKGWFVATVKDGGQADGYSG